jgi:Rha family phage regulatory protein
VTAKIIKLRQIDGIIYASSLDVANDFGKRHDHIIRDIDVIIQEISPNLGRSWFRPDAYFDRHGRRQRLILMSEEGWQFVNMNIQGMYDWKVAYILEFKRMREKLAGITPTNEREKFPPNPQSDLFGELAIIDPAHGEAELEKFCQFARPSNELPPALVPIDDKQKQAFIEAFARAPRQGELRQWLNDSPQVCYGPGGRLVERWDFEFANDWL